MTKQEYKKRSGALRKLLKGLHVPPQNGRRFEYTFGAVMDGPTKTWHVYNYNSNNRIATVKFLEDKAIIRYRQNSHYSGIIKSLKYQRGTITISETIAVPSLHLGERATWLREQLRRRIQSRLEGTEGVLNASHTGFVSEYPTRRGQRVRLPTPANNAGVRRDRNGRLRDRRGRFVSASTTRRSTYVRVQERIREMQEANTVSFASNPAQLYGTAVYRGDMAVLDMAVQPDTFYVSRQQMAELRNMENPDATEE